MGGSRLLYHIMPPCIQIRTDNRNDHHHEVKSVPAAVKVIVQPHTHHPHRCLHHENAHENVVEYPEGVSQRSTLLVMFRAHGDDVGDNDVDHGHLEHRVHDQVEAQRSTRRLRSMQGGPQGNREEELLRLHPLALGRGQESGAFVLLAQAVESADDGPREELEGEEGAHDDHEHEVQTGGRRVVQNGRLARLFP